MAMLAAKEGASVVVNDLGATVDGEGAASQQPAEVVVEEIRKAGGKAVANYESVAEPKSAEKIVQCALDNFKRIDGVINNAGILRDRIFHRMSVVDFDQVIKVHLYGAFYVSRAAANHFKDQESGAFVHFTSTSGLIGNFGQANYAAAKRKYPLRHSAAEPQPNFFGRLRRRRSLISARVGAQRQPWDNSIIRNQQR
jgi:NAD(P)-dependent dehydrogenase (short-subunit alcohol dehydrogenase family)